MELKLLNAEGQAASNVAAPDTIFGRDYNEALIHQVVVAYQANARSVKKVRVVLVLVCHLLHCGVEAVALSLTLLMRTSLTKLTRRCIAQVSARFCLSWRVKVV